MATCKGGSYEQELTKENKFASVGEAQRIFHVFAFHTTVEFPFVALIVTIKFAKSATYEKGENEIKSESGRT
jgi:hypothetical protein